MSKAPSPHRKHDERLLRFERHLRQAKLSGTAVVHYVGVVRRGLLAGDLLVPLRSASSPGGAKIAKAALVRWAAFTEDAGLERKVREVGAPPRPQARPAGLTAEQRARILDQVDRISGPVRRGCLLLVIWSGQHVGWVLDADRAALAAWQSGQPDVQRGARLLLDRLPDGGGKRVRDLLMDTIDVHDRSRASSTDIAAYATVRRMLRTVCADAKLHYVSPEEFRRLVLAFGQNERSKSDPGSGGA